MPQTPVRRLHCFGILGHVGNQNLGDEAIIAAVIQNIRSRYPDAEIRGFTINPDDTEKRHGITAFPLRRTRRSANIRSDATAAAPARAADGLKSFAAKHLRYVYAPLKLSHNALVSVLNAAREIGFLQRSSSHLRGMDSLIIAGSQQLNDFVGGPWAFPYTIFKWCLLARIRKVRILFLSVGAGPVTSRLGRFLVRRALGMAHYRSFRDARSVKLAGELRVKGENVLVPDLVFSHAVRAGAQAPAPEGSRPVVGINPVPLFYSGYWHDGDESAYRQYVSTLAAFADRLLARGFRVSFFSTQLKVDPAVIADIRSAMRNRPGADVTVPSIQDFDDLAAAIAGFDFVVATRYHGILISLLLEKPVLALAYHGKSRDLMDMLGLGNLCLDAHDCTMSSIENRFLAMLPKRHEITDRIRACLPRFRRLLADQYDEIFRTPMASRLQCESDTPRKSELMPVRAQK